MNRVIWIAGPIALAAVILFLARTGNDGEHKPPPAPPVPSPAPEPGFAVESIQCPVCEGYGYLMEKKTTRARRRVCELCGGKGGKVLRIPPGNVRCPACQGFGRVETAKRYIACRRCGGRGYIRQPFQPPE